MTTTSSQLISEVEALAKQAGDKYFYGGTSPSTGFDCSGLIYDALIQLGYKNPPRTSEQQYAWVNKVDKSQLEPGDLVFAQFPGDNASPGHVGIYIGGGNVFSAQDPAAGIGISSLASWGSAIVGYGRVPNTTETGGGTTETTGATSLGLGGILSIPSDITNFFSEADGFVTKLMWIVQPGNWLRIGAFALGVILLLGAIVVFTKADQKISAVPVPVPI